MGPDTVNARPGTLPAGALSVAVVLLGALSAASAEESPDLTSLAFARAPAGNDVTLSPAAVDDGDAPADPATAAEDRRQRAAAAAELAAKIDEQAREAGRSKELIADLTSLAAMYRELGQELLAMAALEQARQITRVNGGLYTLDQAAIVEQMIDDAEAAGAFGQSDSLQDSLLELAMRNDGDPRAPSVVVAVADRQMAAVDDYLDAGAWQRNRESLGAVPGSGWEPTTSKAGRHNAGTRLAQIARMYDDAIEDALTSDDYEIGDPLGVDVGLPEIYRLIDTANDFAEEGILPRGITVPTSLAWSNAVPSVGGSISNPWEAPDPASDREWALQTFRRARRLYSIAMQDALGSDNRGEYLGLEERFLETYYFEIAHPDLHPQSCHVSCAGGRHPERAATLLNVLQARLIDRMTNGASAVEVAEALIDLADLYPNRAALDKYRLAHDFLVGEGTPAETVSELFSPEVPAIRMAFLPEDSIAFDPARSYAGHIDVSVEIGRYGDTHDVDIVDETPGTPRAVEKHLKSHVLRTEFRPRFVDGEPARSDRFVSRYYYNY